MNPAAEEARAFWEGMWLVVRFIFWPLRIAYGTVWLIGRWLEEKRLRKGAVA